MHYQSCRNGTGQGNRSEILPCVVGHPGVERHRDRIRIIVPHEQRIAVRLRFCDDVRANDACVPGSVLDDDRLSHNRYEAVGDLAREDVGKSARWEAYDHANARVG